MIRAILKPENAKIQLDIPEEYIGREIEVNLWAIDEIEQQTTPKSMADFWGILSDKTADEMRIAVNESRKEWERDI